MAGNKYDSRKVATICAKCKHAVEPLQVRKYGMTVAYQCPNCDWRWDVFTKKAYKGK